MTNYSKTNLPELDRLFAQFERGEFPNFLDLMAAISNISDASFVGHPSFSSSSDCEKDEQRVSNYPCDPSRPTKVCPC